MIAYGFAHGHVRHNMKAMVRYGLIRHAKDSHELTQQLRQALACTQSPAPYDHDRASASAAILDLIGHTASARDDVCSSGRTRHESHDGSGDDFKQPSSLAAT